MNRSRGFFHSEPTCTTVYTVVSMSRMSREAERRAWTAFVESAYAPSIATSRVTAINFTVDTEPIPQGSMGGICTTNAAGQPVTVLKADNPRTHRYRNLVGHAALQARAAADVHNVFAGPGVPVRVSITFVFKKPKSAPASRTYPTVPPDLDKLTRAVYDSLKGVLYADDGQVIDGEQHKIYGQPEGVHISVQLVESRGEI
jgi:Holliday junction resolvase RusA-like endonuclease